MVVGSNGASICLSVLWGARPASELHLIPEFCDSEILTVASYYIFYFYPHVVNLQTGSLYYQSSLFVFKYIYLFIWLCQVLLVACGTLAPRPGIEHRSTCSGSMESSSLDHQGSPYPSSLETPVRFLGREGPLQKG